MSLQAITDLRAVIEHAITQHPRTLQSDLGPSDIGTGCTRCLALLLAGHKPEEPNVPWLPTVGTALHEWLETTVLQHLAATGGNRYLPEVRVTVGQLRGQNVHGNCDLYDTTEAAVIDYKVTGTTTLKKVRAHGPGDTYRNQIHLYGKGMTALGFPVRSVAIWFLPRNGMRITDGRVFTEPYNPARADAALSRANAIAGGVDALGLDAVLAQVGPHTGSDFACSKWGPTDPSAAPAVEDTTRQLAGLIPA